MTRDNYPGLGLILQGFETMADEPETVDDIGYREAEAAYKALMALSWFGNYGKHYSDKIGSLQQTFGERIGRDPHEDTLSLDPVDVDSHDCKDYAVWNEYPNSIADEDGEVPEGEVPRICHLEGTCRKCGSELVVGYSWENVYVEADDDE